MPEISRFFGIVIYLYFRDHPPPHFHACYNDFEAKYSISDGTCLEGHLPKTAAKLVLEWYNLHAQELQDAWQRAQQRQLPGKIDPLE